VQQLPLGELVHLADVELPAASAPGKPGQEGVTMLHFPQTGQTIHTVSDYWREHGGENDLARRLPCAQARGSDRAVYTLRHSWASAEVDAYGKGGWAKIFTAARRAVSLAVSLSFAMQSRGRSICAHVLCFRRKAQ
jgi:hypothetical protein